MVYLQKISLITARIHILVSGKTGLHSNVQATHDCFALDTFSCWCSLLCIGIQGKTFAVTSERNWLLASVLPWAPAPVDAHYQVTGIQDKHIRYNFAPICSPGLPRSKFHISKVWYTRNESHLLLFGKTGLCTVNLIYYCPKRLVYAQ